MLARHRSNTEHKADAREERDACQNHQQIARRDDRLGALRFRVQRIPQQPEGLALIEALLALLDRRDECAAILPGVADVAEQTHLQRGVHHSRDDERENDGWSNEEQFAIEAHSGN